MSETSISTKDQKLKEAYFTASQGQLIWQRYKKNKSALIGAWVLIILVLSGIFAPFLTPYDATISGRDKEYLNGAPQVPSFCDDNGCSLRPFIYSYERTRSIKTNFRWVTEINTDIESRRYVEFFVEGVSYTYLKFDINLPGDALDFTIPGLTFNTHLFGVTKGQIHIFGTDSTGKDIYSRTLTAINTSMAVGTIGVFIAFVMALCIGGVAGYYGGWIDSSLQMITDTVRTIPSIPLFMALAAFIPPEWSAEARFFFISMVLGLINWPTLARRVRTHLLTERSQEYVLAAQLSGASGAHVIRKHLLPSFTSYIIVDLVISFPYMVLSETALSFIGLGLKDPVNSLGVMLQNVTSADVLLNYQWYFIPVIFFIALVLAFVFVGDGLRDAADPYGSSNK
ncbi:MAG: ABC transporter permease [Hyphomicrobiales bacterium]